MAHITFIHGISNKPEPPVLLRDWKNALSDGGLNLDVLGVTTSMVYWADVMYPQPESDDSAYESAQGSIGTRPSDDDYSWTNQLAPEERAFVDAMRLRLRVDKASPGGDDYQPEPPTDEDQMDGIQFEAVPLPWFIKRRLMKRLLKDVYYYLFNPEWTHATTGEVIRPRDHIRRLFVDQMIKDSQSANGPHIVVSHSMGTVIAYDCLKYVAECPSVLGLMTVGSPLGISEVHDRFEGYDKKTAYPSGKAGGWVNICDRLDPVALDADLANDYQDSRERVIQDLRVKNRGKWRHSSWKYFNQELLCEQLRTMLRR